MVTRIMDVINYIATGISIAGSIIIIWGALITVFNFLVFEKDKIVNANLPNGSEAIRHKFGTYLLLGLDFTLAADIIHTIHNPVLKELYVLAIIVGIRSVINYFLLKELASIKSGKPIAKDNRDKQDESS